MKNQALLTDIAKMHKELTATQMTNSSFCFPTAGDPTFTVTWNHNAPSQVMLYIYNGKCVFSYGSNSNANNPTVALDSQDGQGGGYIAQVVTLSGSSVAVSLESYTNMASASGVAMVGVSW